MTNRRRFTIGRACFLVAILAVNFALLGYLWRSRSDALARGLSAGVVDATIGGYLVIFGGPLMLASLLISWLVLRQKNQTGL
jgi:hypothetical protein